MTTDHSTPSNQGPQKAGLFQSPTFVIQSGIITTAIALGLVYWLSFHADISPMGFYLNYVIPIGAIGVGALAASGYIIAALKTNLKITGKLLVLMLLIQAGAYIAGEYIEYRQVMTLVQAQEPDAPLPGFWEYYDYKARNWTWKPDSLHKDPEPLGAVGYVFLLLGGVGFTAMGGVLPFLAMRKKYCDTCQRYMVKKPIVLIPASLPKVKINKKDLAEKLKHEEESKAVATYAANYVDRLVQLASARDAQGIMAHIASASVVPVGQGLLPVAIRVDVDYCENCGEGYFRVMQVTREKKNQSTEKLIAGAPLPAEMVQALREGATMPRPVVPIA